MMSSRSQILSINKKNFFLCVKRKKTLLFLISLFIFTTAIVYASYDLFADKKQIHQERDYISALDLPHSRTLVILLDALRKDFAFSNYMPFISSCRARGAWGISEVVSTPLSIAGDHAIFAGKVAHPLAIFEDFKGSTSSYDNIFKRAIEQNKRAVILSSHCLRGAYGEYTDLTVFKPKRFLFSQYREDADYLFQHAYTFLKKEKWDFAVVQCVALDFVGHLETPLSPNSFKMLRILDDYVRQLVGLTTDLDNVLITSEHGMDNNGFHVDRTPAVIETPFILWGPRVKKCGPKKILQIDWAPTLSVLIGVSPFYKSPALPALNLIKLSAKDKSILIKGFSRHIAGESTSLTLNELRRKRLEDMRIKGSLASGIFMVFATIVSMVLFVYLALCNSTQGRDVHSMVMLLGVGTLGLCLFIGILSYLGIFDYISRQLPFSANLIFAHPFKVTMTFLFMVVFPLLYLRIFGKKGVNTSEIILLFLSTFVFAGIFLSASPYYLLNWVVLSIPLVAWGLSRRPAWIVIFCTVWIGLAIRRLTFYNVYSPIELPERWLLFAVILTIGMAFLWWKLRADPKRTQTLWIGVLCFVPAILVVKWIADVEVRAIMLLLCLIPIALASFEKPEAGDVWWALGVTFFCLGTSSSINNTTHIVVFPLLLAAWSIARGLPPVAKGIVVSLVVFIFYLMPGNSFDLKLIDLSDRFIIGSVTQEHIGCTVMVIASRYILPVAVLISRMKCSDSHISMSSVVSTSLLPVICGIGVIYTMMISGHLTGYPWDQLARIIVLFGYFVILLFGFVLGEIIFHAKNLFQNMALKIRV